MLALREDWYLSPTGGESQGMRDLLRVKLPLSVCVCGGGRQEAEVCRSDFTKKVSSAPPWVPPSPPHLHPSGIRVFADKPGQPLTNAFPCLSLPPLLLRGQHPQVQARKRGIPSTSAPGPVSDGLGLCLLLPGCAAHATPLGLSS